MKLSILIPMYNAEKYIGNCLNSLINQDLNDYEYEIIIIDDESTDGSVELVQGFMVNQPNISLYKEKNAGAYSTRNKLLKLAKGDYIYNIDADDYIIDNCLKNLLNIAIKNDVDILGFNTLETEDLDLNEPSKKDNLVDFSVISGLDFLENHNNHRLEIWWYIIKRDYLNKESFSFDKGEYIVDMPFTFNIFLKAKKIIYLPIEIHRYVKVPTSIMQSENKYHLAKLIEEYVSVICRLETSLQKIERGGINPEIIKSLAFKKTTSTYFMFLKMIKSRLSIKEIGYLLKKLEDNNSYPMKGFIGEKYYSLKFKLTNYIFNNKFLFYFLLYPLRLLYRFKLIKIY